MNCYTMTDKKYIYNGCSLSDMTAAYGTKRCFVVQDDTVTSIQYLSTVLDE